MAHLETDRELSSATQDRAAHPKKWIASATAKKLAMAPGIFCVLFTIASAFAIAHWPFSKANMTKRLEQLSSAKVDVGGFYKTFFPLPGCVLENVTIHLPPADGVDATVTIRKLKIQTTFMGFFKPNELRESGSGWPARAPAYQRINIHRESRLSRQDDD